MVQKSISLKMEVKALGFSKVKFCFGMCCPIALVNFQHVFMTRMSYPRRQHYKIASWPLSTSKWWLSGN